MNTFSASKSNTLFTAAMVLLAFAGSLLTISTIGFIARVPITPWWTYGALFIALCAGLLAHPPKQSGLLGTFLAFMLLALFGAVSLLIPDFSGDGIAYHQEAIVALQNGYNPFYENYSNTPLQGTALWVNHYAKASWVLHAAVAQTTGWFEVGKLFQWLFAFCAFAFWRTYLNEINLFKPHQRTFLSHLIAANPVVLYQLFSTYVDGQLYSLLAGFIALILLFTKGRKEALPLAIVAFVLLANIKLSALVWGLIAGGSLAVYGFVTKPPNWQHFFYAAAAAGALSLIIGFNPFITNTINHGHIFFPATGKKAEELLQQQDVIAWQVAPDFINQSNGQKLAGSLLSQSLAAPENGLENFRPQLKIPFLVTPKELVAFTAQDAKFGGFGPLFSGLLVLTVVGIIWLSLIHPLSTFYVVGACGLILFAAILFPHSWWVRLAPHTWTFVPLGYATWAILANYTRKAKIELWLFIFVAFLNTAMVFGPYTARQGLRTLNWLGQVETMQSARAVYVHDQARLSLKNKLERNGVFAQPVSQLPCKNTLPEGFDPRKKEDMLCVENGEPSQLSQKINNFVTSIKTTLGWNPK